MTQTFLCSSRLNLYQGIPWVTLYLIISNCAPICWPILDDKSLQIHQFQISSNLEPLNASSESKYRLLAEKGDGEM